LLVLTGAGISAESGIPTFRGADGFWTIGSRNYRPEELATRSAFMRMPEEMWAWYLYRRSRCCAALPNRAHQALSLLEDALQGRFLLITQNIDGLHLRAGNSRPRTYEIHGNLDYMRCSRECQAEPIEIPLPVRERIEGKELEPEELDQLVCPICGVMSRPHVLWFDETYDEERYRYASSIQAANEASLLLVIGTTGQTSLPVQIGALVAQRKVPLVVIDPEPNIFSRMAEESGQGVFVQGFAGEWVPRVIEGLIELHRKAQIERE
jgi:NAD-dependent deacetylase